MLLMNTVITKNNTMLVLRPYQCYAVQNIVNRVNEGIGNGYIWHTTGSGKTLIMLFPALFAFYCGQPGLFVIAQPLAA